MKDKEINSRLDKIQKKLSDIISIIKLDDHSFTFEVMIDKIEKVINKAFDEIMEEKILANLAGLKELNPLITDKLINKIAQNLGYKDAKDLFKKRFKQENKEKYDEKK